MTERSTRGPFIARIRITPTWENREIRDGFYRSLAHVDAMLARAFTRQPPPDGKPYLRMEYQIVWTDGYEWNSREFFDASGVAEGMRRGGILRHYLWRTARALSASEYPVVAESGQALARRLEASVEPDTHAHRNIGTSPWGGPTLLPDPYAVLADRRDRYTGRRPIVVAPVEISNPTGRGDAPSIGYPATTNADVRYLINWISVALTSDLRQVPVHASLIWDSWRATVETVESVLRVDGERHGATYVDNEGLWLRQLPRIVAMLATAMGKQAVGRRNGRLRFLPVGDVGDPYPDWFQALRDVAGVYVIRERQDDGSLPIVYVGSAKANLYATISRHLQSWRRRKSFWQGMHGSHDPGLTYARNRVEVAVILTAPDDARRVEYATIESLAPRDNLIGQAAPPPEIDSDARADVPF